MGCADGVRRRRADLETGRGSFVNHPVHRAVLDYERTQENVARLQANLAGRRLGRRERREKETELARWRRRLGRGEEGAGRRWRPELRRTDRAEKEITSHLNDLHRRRDERLAWFAGHPEAARRLERIDEDIGAMNVVVAGRGPGAELARGPMRDRPWRRGVPAAGRSPELAWACDTGLALGGRRLLSVRERS